MKRKIWLSFLIGILACLISVFFVACGNESNTKNGLFFNTLTVEETTVYGTVANNVETFSFIDEIKTEGKTKFTVSLDVYGSQIVATKTIPLEIGDNIVYITELIDDEPANVFTVTIRRRPMYSVTINNGTLKYMYPLEEDSLIDIPTEPIREGYNFKGWSYDFSQPVKNNISISAIWEARTDTKYIVNYYLENLENDEYTLYETEELMGETDSLAVAEIKEYPHFTYNKANSVVQGGVCADGSLILDVYYERNEHNVTFDGNGGILITGDAIQRVKHGGNATVPVFEKEGYTFDGFDKINYTNIVEDLILTAKWSINQYTLTIIYDNGQPDKLVKQDYNTEIEKIEQPEKAGYIFLDWDKTIPVNMPAMDVIIKAQWQNIFLLANNTIIALTDYAKENLNKLNIPHEIDGIEITAIGENAFWGCENLIQIVIPNSVQSIGDNAFDGCYKLVEVVNKSADITIIKGGLNNGKVGRYALAVYNSDDIFEASGISDDNGYVVYTADQEKFLVGYVGEECDLVIPAYIDRIIDNAFSGCKNVTSVMFDGNSRLKHIGNYAFSNCTVLKKIELPYSLTEIGSYAFMGCKNLTQITIPYNVKKIGKYAFSNCTHLTSISFADSAYWSVNTTNSSGSIVVIVETPTTNATYFKSTYMNYYWFNYRGQLPWN